MPKSVMIVLLVEVALILFATLCLTKPQWMFRNLSVRASSTLKWCGFFLLCILFCWSVLTGVVLSMSGLTLRI